MPMYRQTNAPIVEARLITKDNKEDITEWCQNHPSFRMVRTAEIIGDNNIGDYVVQFDFGFVVMAKEVFELFYKEKK